MSFWVILFVSLFSFSSSAQESFGAPDSSSSHGDQFLINLSFFYTGDNFELSVDRKRTDTLIQGTLGLIYNGWLFGLTYDSDVEKQSFTSGNTTQDVSWTRAAYGPTVGYFFSDFYAHLSYFIDPTLNTVDDLNNVNTKYSRGSGLQLAVGYNYRIAPSFALGLQVAYRSFQYSQSVVGTTTTTGTFRQAMVDPMLTLFIYL